MAESTQVQGLDSCPRAGRVRIILWVGQEFLPFLLVGFFWQLAGRGTGLQVFSPDRSMESVSLFGCLSEIRVRPGLGVSTCIKLSHMELWRCEKCRVEVIDPAAE